METKQMKGVNVQVIDISKAIIDDSDSGTKQCRIVGRVLNGIGFLFSILFAVWLALTISFYIKHKDNLDNIESITEESYNYKYKVEFLNKEGTTITLGAVSVVFIVLGSILQIIAFNAKNAAIANNIRYTMLVEMNALNQKISS